MTPALLLAAFSFLSSEEGGLLHQLVPHVEEAAYLSGERQTLLLSIVALESRGNAQAEARGSVWGAGQVSWRDWGLLLREEGVAQEAPDLLDPRDGTVGIGVVLQDLRKRYARRWPMRWRDHAVLCLYGHGRAALAFREGCDYSRRVLGLERRLQRELVPMEVAVR